MLYKTDLAFLSVSDGRILTWGLHYGGGKNIGETYGTVRKVYSNSSAFLIECTNCVIYHSVNTKISYQISVLRQVFETEHGWLVQGTNGVFASFGFTLPTEMINILNSGTYVRIISATNVIAILTTTERLLMYNTSPYMGAEGIHEFVTTKKIKQIDRINITRGMLYVTTIMAIDIDGKYHLCNMY